MPFPYKRTNENFLWMCFIAFLQTPPPLVRQISKWHTPISATPSRSENPGYACVVDDILLRFFFYLLVMWPYSEFRPKRLIISNVAMWILYSWTTLVLTLWNCLRSRVNASARRQWNLCQLTLTRHQAPRRRAAAVRTLAVWNNVEHRR